MRISDSELILNPDGTIYHLHLKPEDIADTIITVGDPDRVASISKYFDSLEVTVHKREFKTHTGIYKGKRLTVISTGIGTDNIDIVFNELDALVNIDFETRTIKDELRSLTIVRVGTSGALNEDIPIDSILVSEAAIGFDNLIYFYDSTDFMDAEFSTAFVKYTGWNPKKSFPYVVKADSDLLELFSSEENVKGITATHVGFYGPQGRVLRLSLENHDLNNRIASFDYKGKKITNFEMETSGIYGMSRLLGHRAVSLNAILANRALGTFSNNPELVIDKLIRQTLKTLVP